MLQNGPNKTKHFKKAPKQKQTQCLSPKIKTPQNPPKYPQTKNKQPNSKLIPKQKKPQKTTAAEKNPNPSINFPFL